jgi:hypothetical protein
MPVSPPEVYENTAVFRNLEQADAHSQAHFQQRRR